jgi:hypothetical protein
LSKNELGERENIGQALFLPVSEKWLDGIIKANKEKNEKDLIQLIQDRLDTMVQANIEYHNVMTRYYVDNENDSGTAYHKLMAQVYKLICKKEQ